MDLQEARDIRKINHNINSNMKSYIFACKQNEYGVNECDECGSLEDLEIHHKRYGLDVTIHDLQILCSSCHNKSGKERLDYKYNRGESLIN